MAVYYYFFSFHVNQCSMFFPPGLFQENSAEQQKVHMCGEPGV